MRLLGLRYDVAREKWRHGSPVHVGWSYYGDRRAGLTVRFGTHGYGFAVVPEMKTNGYGPR